MWHYRQTDGQNIYRIDAHLWGETAQKNWNNISIRGQENHVSPETWLTYGHTDRRTEIWFYRVALLLITQNRYSLLWHHLSVLLEYNFLFCKKIFTWKIEIKYSLHKLFYTIKCQLIPKIGDLYFLCNKVPRFKYLFTNLKLTQ